MLQKDATWVDRVQAPPQRRTVSSLKTIIEHKKKS